MAVTGLTILMKEKMLQRETVEFILERIHRAWQMQGYVCSADGDILISTANNDESDLRILPDAGLIKEIYGKCQVNSIPVVSMEEDMIYYMAFLDGDWQMYLIGPIATEKLTFFQNHMYCRRHGITEKNCQIPYLPPARALTCLSMVYYMVTGQIVSEKELMQENETLEGIPDVEHSYYQIQQDSEENRRYSYRNEKEWLAQIENGTLQKKQVQINAESMKKLDRVGRLAHDNSFKQYEYMAISQICLASRAAMRGGMNTYDAYTLSDMYYQKVSRCTDIMELLKICLMVEQDFSEQVRLAKERNQKENYIEQCKDYIARHRMAKFTISQMAEELGLSRSYLSRRFSEQTGITIQEYILQIRLEAAANMLQFSEEKIGTIAEYLCFPSQSYFTERFRKQYGMTPGEYRKDKQVVDFKGTKI